MISQDAKRSSTEQDSASSAKAGTGVPTVELPKGGGAIRGIGEKFATNPATGTGAMSIPIATSAGRAGFGPQLSLSYDSGAGNGPFGFGWSLALPSITRKTGKGLPQYVDCAESDVFVLSGVEDLVPVLVRNRQGEWERVDAPARTVDGVHYHIDRYRPRIEGQFASIERWTNADDPQDVFWRSISKDNVTAWYGKTPESRIADPMDASRIFSWLICQSHDDKGNVLVYGYKAEDSANIFRDASGRSRPKAHERNRTDGQRSAQRYLKRIRYGNRSPYFPLLAADAPWPAPPDAAGADGSEPWMFEVVLDYGDHAIDAPTPGESGAWPARPDPFSSYRAGFELRTYRTCRRVLMFHHFPDESDVGRDCLVRATEFTYSDEIVPTDVRNPVYTFLQAVTQSGYRRHRGGYDKRSLPPVAFAYTEPIVQDRLEEVDPASLENLPIGLDGAVYRWTDLHGEGVPGILTEQGGAWFYKRNLSPMGETAEFAPLESVALKPNAALGAGAEFMDLAGDGRPDLVVMEGPAPGLYEHDDAEGWQPFRPFKLRLNRDLSDPNLKFVDLDGDGNADVLITEDDAFVWHASLAEAGFGPARRTAQALDEEEGPRIVFADASQSIHLADLSGDGLADLVRIRNGEVCYWPNLGYGRFGAKVTMDNAPWFDNPDQFDHRRIRLADIDGSGTTDLIYLHREGVRLYFNQSGNGWSQPYLLKVFPRPDDLVNIVPTDLLGNGTVCLVWSSPLPGDAGRPMRYVNLMGSRKPHLLVKVDNNLGMETRVDYAPSTRFYLQDKRDGKPWITRLPFPVHVVERVETHDHIGRNRFVTRYAYHHGYYDGEEREFRGFGMVEQWDTEQFAALADGGAPGDMAAEARVPQLPPVHTKTWFHTGVYLDRERVARHLENEYFREPGLGLGTARPLLLDDTVVPSGLAPEEEREACRALKGSMLRLEIYADDAGHPGATAAEIRRAGTPYTVKEQQFAIRTLQPRCRNRHAVFFTHVAETLAYQYERNPADPRVQHTLTLEVDDYGNVLKQAVIGYGRRASPLEQEWDRARQTTPLLTLTESRVTKAVAGPDSRRNPLPCAAVTYELTGYEATGPAGRYRSLDFVEPDPAAPGRLRHRVATPEVAYEARAGGGRRRRPVESLRTLYRRDDLSGLLPLGELQAQALPGESYKLALTPGLIDQVFRRPGPEENEALLPDPAAVLGSQAGDGGGYLASQALKADGRFPASEPDDHWWMPSGLSFYTTDPEEDAATELAHARRHFFLPRRYRDPFGQDVRVDFDGHDLLITGTRDALGNRISVHANDYRILQPRLVSDPNRNRTEVAFDALGMVVGTAVMGKAPPAPQEGDALDGFVADLPQETLDGFFDAADPQRGAAALLGGATTRILYDLDRFRRTRQAYPHQPDKWQPPCAATLVRETHLNAALPPQGLKIQLSFSYSDGAGRVIQQKIRAEAGPVPQRDADGKPVVGAHGQPVPGPHASPRWVGTGWTVFNNKDNPVRQFEPFFTDTHQFEFDVRIGVSAVLFYDPVERVIATLHPNHSYEKLVFDAWRQTAYDANDTCAPRKAQTGDPRSDPDIGGHVAPFFETQPATWQTWYAQRVDGAMGVHERNAALRAAAHADTPTTVHFDALGRPFLTVTHNRVVCPGHEQDGIEECYSSRVELDIEGNKRAVRDASQSGGDALGRIVMRYAYDMLGKRIHQLSMEAGARWVLSDVSGKPIRAWDSRGHAFTTTYDALRRPLRHTVRGTTAASDPRTLHRDILVDRIDYGEAVARAEALNLRTRVYRHCDSAGVLINARLDADGEPTEAYDFKGNLLRTTRRLVSDYRAIPDWEHPPQLDEESFTNGTRYDALNRAIQSIAPHSNLDLPGRSKGVHIIQPVFNEANLLERVDVWLERAVEPEALLDPAVEPASPVGVADIDYDAMGQRLRIDYKNGATTRYSRDPLTLRLRQMITRREAAVFPGDDPQAVDADRPGRQLQNLRYTYDPTGNMTHIQDDAQQTVYFRNKRVDPGSDYTYDALYRLLQASGREHLGQGGAPIPHSHDDAGRVGLAGGGRFAPGDGGAMGPYIERYAYDAAGNVLNMQHRGSDPAHPGWTRGYHYLEASLIGAEDGGAPPATSNRLSRSVLNPAGDSPQPETYRYDAHGNMLRMPHLGGCGTDPNLFWDYADHLLQADLGGGGKVFHVYDAAGERVRKVWEKAPGLVEERIYLGGCELFRRHGGTADVTLERETLHIMDDQQRIALVETRLRDTSETDPAPRRLIRYQFSNHLGSASLEVDDAAQIISYEEYSPYGSSTYQAVRSQTESPKRYRFTGRERDAESGFYYHGARYYAPWLCRWVSCDPLGLEAGPNLYLYCGGNPLNRTDTGSKEWEFCNPFTDEQCTLSGTADVVAEKAGEARDYVRESDTAQFVMGLGTGGLAGAAPGGFVVGIGGEATGAAERFPRAFRMGYGLGEAAWGVAQIIVGGVGEVGGGALVLGGGAATATGAGAPVGVPAMAGGALTITASTAAIVEGAADIGTGFGVFMSAWREGDELPEGTHKIVDDPNLDQTRSMTHAEALEQSLERQGMPRPPGHEPHHIAAASDPRAARAREILEEAGIGVDDAANGVWLPRTSQGSRTGQVIQAEAATSHDTIHSARYYEALTERLERAQEADRVLDELEFIRLELELGHKFW